MAIIEENEKIYEDKKRENLLLLPPIKKLVTFLSSLFAMLK